MDHFFRDQPSDFSGHLLQVHHLIAAEKNVDPLRH